MCLPVKDKEFKEKNGEGGKGEVYTVALSNLAELCRGFAKWPKKGENSKTRKLTTEGFEPHGDKKSSRGEGPTNTRYISGFRMFSFMEP